MMDIWQMFGVQVYYYIFVYLEVYIFCIKLVYNCYKVQPFEDDNVGKLLEKIVAADFEIPKSASKTLRGIYKLNLFEQF